MYSLPTVLLACDWTLALSKIHHLTDVGNPTCNADRLQLRAEMRISSFKPRKHAVHQWPVKMGRLQKKLNS